MGDEADDILRSFSLSEAEKKVYDTVKEKFENHFVKKRNVIFERVEWLLSMTGRSPLLRRQLNMSQMPEEGTLSESLSIGRKRWKALQQRFGIIFG